MQACPSQPPDAQACPDLDTAGVPAPSFAECLTVDYTTLKRVQEAQAMRNAKLRCAMCKHCTTYAISAATPAPPKMAAQA